MKISIAILALFIAILWMMAQPTTAACGKEANIFIQLEKTP